MRKVPMKTAAEKECLGQGCRNGCGGRQGREWEHPAAQQGPWVRAAAGRKNVLFSTVHCRYYFLLLERKLQTEVSSLSLIFYGNGAFLFS